MDFLAQYPVEDQVSATFLLESICAPVCPLSVEIPPFQIKLMVWINQEDYLFARRARELVRLVHISSGCSDRLTYFWSISMYLMLE